MEPADTQIKTAVRPPALLFGLAFGCLGLLVGTLLAFSAQSLVQAVVAAIFAFFGGSVLAVIGNKTRAEQQAVALGTLGISLGALVGVYSGIYVNEHELLSPPGQKTSKASSAATQEQIVRKYLRESVLPPAAEIDQKRRNRVLTNEQAYEQLYKLLGE
jgi:ABC-type enterochelin transport system permease subunit